MKYVYYPGCSLEGTAREYDLATRAMLQAVGVELIEIENWTCCGASAAEPISRLLSLALPARNIALAEAHTDIDDILVPCSACYLNLKKVTETVKKEPATLSTLNGVLAEEGLELKRPMNVRHLLDVLPTKSAVFRISALHSGWTMTTELGYCCFSNVTSSG